VLRRNERSQPAGWGRRCVRSRLRVGNGARNGPVVVTERDVLGGDRIRRYTRARMSWAAEPGRADDAAGAPHDLLLLGPPGRLLGLEALNVRERRMPPVHSEIVLRAEHRIVTLGAVRLRTDEELSRAWGGRTDGRLLVHRTVAGRAWLGPATERGGRRTAGHRDDRSFTPSSHDRRRGPAVARRTCPPRRSPSRAG
jgi:hypothetical protein